MRQMTEVKTRKKKENKRNEEICAKDWYQFNWRMFALDIQYLMMVFLLNVSSVVVIPLEMGGYIVTNR